MHKIKRAIFFAEKRSGTYTPFFGIKLVALLCMINLKFNVMLSNDVISCHLLYITYHLL